MKGRKIFMVVCGLIVLALLVLGGWLLYRYTLPPVLVSFSDHLSSWTLASPYNDGGVLAAKTRSEIADLTDRLRGGQVPEYEAFVGIASQYELLGDGKSSYDYLSRAIRTDRSKGLAYFNLGHLMEELGAFHTARTAYEQAVKAEPYVPAYQNGLTSFLKKHFPNDPALTTP